MILLFSRNIPQFCKIYKIKALSLFKTYLVIKLLVGTFIEL